MAWEGTRGSAYECLFLCAPLDSGHKGGENFGVASKRVFLLGSGIPSGAWGLEKENFDPVWKHGVRQRRKGNEEKKLRYLS